MMKTATSTPRPLPVTVHPLERLPVVVARPTPVDRALGNLAASVCNRTFARDWVAVRTTTSWRRL